MTVPAQAAGHREVLLLALKMAGAADGRFESRGRVLGDG